MSTAPRNWLLTAAAIAAVFQAWLWYENSDFALSVALLGIGIGFLVAAHVPHSRFSQVLRRVWAPPRRPGESEKGYRWRIGIIWLAVAGAAFITLRLSLIAASSHDDELTNQYIFWPLTILIFSAMLMAVQSIALAYTRPPQS